MTQLREAQATRAVLLRRGYAVHRVTFQLLITLTNKVNMLITTNDDVGTWIHFPFLKPAAIDKRDRELLDYVLTRFTGLLDTAVKLRGAGCSMRMTGSGLV